MRLKTKRTLIAFLSAFFLLAGVVGIGFVSFLTMFPQKGEQHVHLDQLEGLVVFTGGTGRIHAGARHLSGGFGGPLFITGVNPDVRLNDILAGIPLSKDKKMSIDLDYTATTTRENVQMTLDWAKRQKIEKIGLITGYYHYPRTRLLLKQAQKSGAAPLVIKALPVYPDDVSVKFLFREYIKFLGTYVRII